VASSTVSSSKTNPWVGQARTDSGVRMGAAGMVELEGTLQVRDFMMTNSADSIESGGRLLNDRATGDWN
jgi:hypothetical protein